MAKKSAKSATAKPAQPIQPKKPLTLLTRGQLEKKCARLQERLDVALAKLSKFRKVRRDLVRQFDRWEAADARREAKEAKFAENEE